MKYNQRLFMTVLAQYRSARNARRVLQSSMLALCILCSACQQRPDSAPANHNAVTDASASQLSPAARLGQKIFNDASLSASGVTSCASCHDPAHAYAQNNTLSVQHGGAHHEKEGFRAAPSLRYLHFTPAFSIDAEGKASGGFNWDGRAASLARQAEGPLLSAHEMANPNRQAVLERLKKAAYAEEFKQVFGTSIFDTADAAFEQLLIALERFQIEDPSFHPFDSKYDQYLAGKVTLTTAETRGLRLFNDTQKGNCAACHSSEKGHDGRPPLFTDFSYDNLGIPRNADLLANADPSYFDLGLCGPQRTDLQTQTALCGAFKVPSLRNVATRKVFFHNGHFKNLQDVLAFYVRRDTHPQEWYPAAPDNARQRQQFNDLPAQYRANVNTDELPYQRKPGQTPVLNTEEINDVIAFLKTLTDGYRE